MNRLSNNNDLDDASLPLRQYPADTGQTSDMPPLANMDSHFESTSKGFDDRDDTRDHYDTNTKRLLLDDSKNGEQVVTTRHQIFDPSHLKQKVRLNQSFVKLFLPGLARCLISWLLIGAFYISLWRYKDRILSPRTKSHFDTITVALSIALGLNVASALKTIALDLRWWFLSMGKRPSREVELILRCDSMTELLRLIIVAPRLSIIIVVLFWLGLNILAQAGIAILGLTYSATPGIEDIYQESGLNNISIPNMAHLGSSTARFIPFDNDNTFQEAFAAHVLGDTGSSYNFSMLPAEPLEGTPWASNPAGFWNATDHWEYVFLDSAPNAVASGVQVLSIYSNRTATSSAICAVPAYNLSMEGQHALIHLLNENQTVVFPAIAAQLESIYYLTTPTPDDGHSDGTCGPGCNNVKVLEPTSGLPVAGSIANGSDQKSELSHFFYDCNITVTSTTDDLPAVKAGLAAQAIALSGQVHSELEDTNSQSNQFVAYNFGLQFGEPQNNSAAGMASQISRFAIGVISAAAHVNPPKFVQGSLPAQGLRLQFDSFMLFNLILLLTGILQFVFVVVTAGIVSRVKIPEEILLSRQESIRNQFVLSS